MDPFLEPPPVSHDERRKVRLDSVIKSHAGKPLERPMKLMRGDMTWSEVTEPEVIEHAVTSGLPGRIFAEIGAMAPTTT